MLLCSNKRTVYTLFCIRTVHAWIYNKIIVTSSLWVNSSKQTEDLVLTGMRAIIHAQAFISAMLTHTPKLPHWVVLERTHRVSAWRLHGGKLVMLTRRAMPLPDSAPLSLFLSVSLLFVCAENDQMLCIFYASNPLFLFFSSLSSFFRWVLF